MDLMVNCASACANYASAASGQKTGSFRATFPATGTDGGGRRSVSAAPISYGVSSTLGMWDKKNCLEHANIFQRKLNNLCREKKYIKFINVYTREDHVGVTTLART